MVRCYLAIKFDLYISIQSYDRKMLWDLILKMYHAIILTKCLFFEGIRFDQNRRGFVFSNRGISTRTSVDHKQLILIDYSYTLFCQLTRRRFHNEKNNKLELIHCLTATLKASPVLALFNSMFFNNCKQIKWRIF